MSGGFGTRTLGSASPNCLPPIARRAVRDDPPHVTLAVLPCSLLIFILTLGRMPKELPE